MLDARENAAYTYVFVRMVFALVSVILAVVGNGVAIEEIPKEIISETAYISLALAAAQAKNSLVDFMAA
jgi:hypothetical protein